VAFAAFRYRKAEKKEFFRKLQKDFERFFAAFRHRKAEKKKKFSRVLLGPKVPKASARRFPRERAIRGAARGAQDQAYAPPRGGHAAARTLFFRVKRECGLVVPPLAVKK